MNTRTPFIERLLPAPVSGGFRMPGYWVWCGSVVRASNPGEDGRFHMFASRWPQELSFADHWVTDSEIVRAVSDTPEGPYTFEEVVLPRRSRDFFDGIMTHNPVIQKLGGIYYLFYVGVTYGADELEQHTNLSGQERYRLAWARKRIGMATAPAITGPWQRAATPLIEPRPGQWDAQITSNPSAAIREDGYTVLIYKSRRDWGTSFQLGIVTAPHPSGPYTRVPGGPVFPFDVEDPFIWWEDNRYHVIMKDFKGTLCGQENGGAYGWSEDGIDWKLGSDPRAYSRTIRWADGTSTTHGNVERPSLLMQDGHPSHLFLAVSSGPDPHWKSSSTYNICVPLRR